MLLSMIIPCYNEEAALPHFLPEARKAAALIWKAMHCLICMRAARLRKAISQWHIRLYSAPKIRRWKKRMSLRLWIRF